VTENLAQFYEMFYNITDNILFCVYEKLDWIFWRLSYSFCFMILPWIKKWSNYHAYLDVDEFVFVTITNSQRVKKEEKKQHFVDAWWFSNIWFWL